MTPAQRVDHLRRRVGLVVDEVRRLAPVPCRAGCWGCCRGEVSLVGEEWRRLEPLVQPAALERLRAQGEHADPTTSLCPLLDPDTRLCTVYEERPLVCRAYVVVTPEDDCYPERVGRQEVGQVLQPLQVLAPLLGEQWLVLREQLWTLARG